MCCRCGQIWANCRLFNEPDDEVTEACGELEKVFNRQWEKEGLKGLARREAEETRRAQKEQEKKQHQRDRQREKKREQKVRERERAKEKRSRERERLRQREGDGEGERGRDRNRKRRAGGSGPSPLKSPAPTPKKTSPKHLRLALKAVKEVCGRESAEAFLEPVDAEALGIPEYHDVIEQPMDLGTVREALEAGPTVGWDNIQFKTLVEVHAAVSLVWSNCLKFNTGEGDDWIRDACEKSAGYFESRWKALGLLDLEKAERGEGPDSGAGGKGVKRRLSAGGAEDDEGGQGGGKKGKRKRKSKSGGKSEPTPEQAAMIAAIQRFTPDMIGRCPVCKVQKKGQCGTETAPWWCLRRKHKGLRYVPALDADGNLISAAARIAEAREIRQREEAAKKAEQERLEAAARAAEREAQRREKLLNKQRERDQAAAGLRAQANQSAMDVKKMEEALVLLREAQAKDLERDEAEWVQREAQAKKVQPGYAPKTLRLPAHVLELGTFFLSDGFGGAEAGGVAGPSETDNVALKALQAVWGGRAGADDVRLVSAEEVRSAALGHLQEDEERLVKALRPEEDPASEPQPQAMW